MNQNSSSSKTSRYRGICTKFVSSRGFGFIRCNDGSGEIFVHCSEIRSGRRSLLEGQKVEFEITKQCNGKRKAINVTSANSYETHQNSSQSIANKDSFEALVKRYNLSSAAPICDICANLGNQRYLRNNYLLDILTRSKTMNVGKLLILGLDRHQWKTAQQACDQYLDMGMLFYGIGVHPHHASQNSNNTINLEREMLTYFQSHSNVKGNSIVCIGECGLDYNRMYSTKHDQCRVFRQHIKVALKLRLPLVCHERDAFEDFIKIINEEILIPMKRNESPIPIVVHCFTGNGKQLQRYISMGFYIGVTTFLCIEHRAKELRRCIGSGYLPLNRLLLETDTPFMKPHFSASDGNQHYKSITKYFKRNEPCLLPLLLNTLKVCYNGKYSTQQIAYATMNNSNKLFFRRQAGVEQMNTDK